MSASIQNKTKIKQEIVVAYPELFEYVKLIFTGFRSTSYWWLFFFSSQNNLYLSFGCILRSDCKPWLFFPFLIFSPQLSLLTKLLIYKYCSGEVLSNFRKSSQVSINHWFRELLSKLNRKLCTFCDFLKINIQALSELKKKSCTWFLPAHRLPPVRPSLKEIDRLFLDRFLWCAFLIHPGEVFVSV